MWETNSQETIGWREQEKDCKQTHSNEIYKTNQSVAKRHFYKHFWLILSNSFQYQTLVAVSGNLGGKVPIVDDVLSSHEQEIYRTTSLDENCIEFEFQPDRNYYVDLKQSILALKLKFVKGRGYDTFESKEKKKEHTEESVVFTETCDDEEEEEVARDTYVKQHNAFNVFNCESVQ